MAGGIIFLIIFVVLIVVGIDDSIKKKKQHKEMLLKEKQEVQEMFSRFSNHALKFAIANNKIGYIFYDPEDVEDYKQMNDEHISQIRGIVEKYVGDLNSSDENKFRIMFLKIKYGQLDIIGIHMDVFGEREILKQIEEDILSLPKAKNYSRGWP
jgi:hypothetical protein